MTGLRVARGVKPRKFLALAVPGNLALPRGLWAVEGREFLGSILGHFLKERHSLLKNLTCVLSVRW